MSEDFKYHQKQVLLANVKYKLALKVLKEQINIID